MESRSNFPPPPVFQLSLEMPLIFTAFRSQCTMVKYPVSLPQTAAHIRAILRFNMGKMYSCPEWHFPHIKFHCAVYNSETSSIIGFHMMLRQEFKRNDSKVVPYHQQCIHLFMHHAAISECRFVAFRSRFLNSTTFVLLRGVQNRRFSCVKRVLYVHK